MINQQITFNQTEAIAICEMIARLTSEDYEVSIGLDKAQPDADGVLFFPYHVTVIDTDGSDVSTGGSYLLIDALSSAYQMTPERQNETI